MLDPDFLFNIFDIFLKIFDLFKLKKQFSRLKFDGILRMVPTVKYHDKLKKIHINKKKKGN